MGHVIVACGLKREAREIGRGGGGLTIVAGGGDAARLEAELEALLVPLVSSSIERSRDAPVETPATPPPSRLRSRLRPLPKFILSACLGRQSKGSNSARHGRGESVGLMLSSGIAGALDPVLRIGDMVVDGDAAVVAMLAHALAPIVAPAQAGAYGFACSRAGAGGNRDGLQPALERRGLVIGAIIGSDAILATSAEKRALHLATRAIAVDMESHIARRVAERHGLTFAALRVISDTADADLPPAALIGMRPDGGMALGAVLGSLARHPAQLPALIRTGINAEKAFRVLGRAHHALGGFPDFGEFRLDMA